MEDFDTSNDTNVRRLFKKIISLKNHNDRVALLEKINPIDEDGKILFDTLSLESDFNLLNFSRKFLAQKKDINVFYNDLIFNNSKMRDFVQNALNDNILFNETKKKKFFKKIPPWFSKNEKFIFSQIANWEIVDIDIFLHDFLDQTSDFFDFAIIYTYHTFNNDTLQLSNLFGVDEKYIKSLILNDRDVVTYKNKIKSPGFDIHKYRNQLEITRKKEKLETDKFFDILKSIRQEKDEDKINSLLFSAEKEIDDDETKEILGKIANYSAKNIRGFFRAFFKQEHGLKEFYNNTTNANLDDNDENINEPIKMLFRNMIRFSYRYADILNDAIAYEKDENNDSNVNVLLSLAKLPKSQVLTFAKSYIESDIINLSDFYAYTNQQQAQPKQFKKRRANVIDAKKKPVQIENVVNTVIPTQQFKPESLKTCLTFYKKYPWIPNLDVLDIFISPIQNIDETFYINSDIHVHNNENFYRPKEKYYLLQCYGTNKHYKPWSHEVEYIFWNNIEFGLKIGIKTPNNFLIQNSEILGTEKNFIDDWLGNYDSRKQQIIDSFTVPDELFTVAKNMIQNSLANIIKNVYTDNILTQIVQEFKKKYVNSRKFIQSISFFLAFLNPNKYFIEIPLFWKRLDLHMYRPEIFPWLTEKDMLPEIFEDFRIPNKTVTDVANILIEQQQIISDQLITATLNFNNIPLRKYREKLQPVAENKITIGLPSWKSLCFNYNDIQTIDDDQLVFYTDVTGDLQHKPLCFDIAYLVQNFSSGYIVNPYSGLPFSQEFVQKILATYSPQNKIPVTTKPKDPPNPWLITMVKQELVKLENKLIPEYFSTFTKKNKCSVCKQQMLNKISSLYKGKPISFCSTACFENKDF